MRCISASTSLSEGFHSARPAAAGVHLSSLYGILSGDFCVHAFMGGDPEARNAIMAWFLDDAAYLASASVHGDDLQK